MCEYSSPGPRSAVRRSGRSAAIAAAPALHADGTAIQLDKGLLVQRLTAAGATPADELLTFANAAGAAEDKIVGLGRARIQTLYGAMRRAGGIIKTGQGGPAGAGPKLEARGNCNTINLARAILWPCCVY